MGNIEFKIDSKNYSKFDSKFDSKNDSKLHSKKKKTSDSTPCFTTCHYCMISESIMDNRMKIDKDKNKKPAIFLYGRLAIG